MIAGIEEHDKFHWVLLSRVVVIKVPFDLPDQVFQVLDPDIWPRISVNTGDIVSKDDSLSDVNLISC